MVSLIAAVSKNGVIGVNNSLPWDLPEDLKRFRILTTGGVVIMGRKTYESIGKALPDRINIVITRNKDFKSPNVIVVNSIEDALFKAGGQKDVFIIGGGEIYEQSMYYIDRMYISEIDTEVDGDTKFPTIDKNRWELTKEDVFKSGRFLVYKKTKVNK